MTIEQMKGEHSVIKFVWVVVRTVDSNPEVAYATQAEAMKFASVLDGLGVTNQIVRVPFFNI